MLRLLSNFTLNHLKQKNSSLLTGKIEAHQVGPSWALLLEKLPKARDQTFEAKDHLDQLGFTLHGFGSAEFPYEALPFCPSPPPKGGGGAKWQSFVLKEKAASSTEGELFGEHRVCFESSQLAKETSRRLVAVCSAPRFMRWTPSNLVSKGCHGGSKRMDRWS